MHELWLAVPVTFLLQSHDQGNVEKWLIWLKILKGQESVRGGNKQQTCSLEQKLRAHILNLK